MAIKIKLSDPPIVVPSENKMGERVNVEVKPRYIYPEPEIQIAEYPAIVLYETSVTPDVSRRRHSGGLIRDGETYDTNGYLVSADYRESPSPYIVTIDVRAYTIFDIQRDIIRREILRRFGDFYGGLDISNVKIPLLNRGETNIPSSSSEAGRKVRITQWRFRAETYFDMSLKKHVKVVRDVHVDLQDEIQI